MTSDSPTITFACGGCGRPFTVPRQFAGRKAVCKSCGNRVVVPGGAETTAQSTDADSKPQTPAAQTVETVVHAAPKAPPIVEAPPRPVVSAAATELATPTVPQAAGQIGIVSEGQSLPNIAGADDISLSIPRTERSSDGTEEPAKPERPAAPGQKPARVPVRVRRLLVDAEQMAKTFSGDGPIRVKSAVGDPPELYQIEYHVKSLQKGWLGKPKSRTEHLVEIQLTSEYPRLSPKCRMLTPIFHPNIDESTICVGDHWTAGARLVDLVIQIGEMLAYQAYNIKSPLDGEAAMWADLNAAKLPTDSRNFHPGEA